MKETLLKATIENIKSLSPRVLEFSLSTKFPITFEPGQFIVIHHKGIERSYSISNQPGNDFIELIVSLNEEGQLTPDLFNKNVGDVIDISEAKGSFLLPDTPQNGICFICTGTGIGPFKSMIETMLSSSVSLPAIHLVFGNRTEEDILYHEYWKDIEAKQDGFHYYPVLSQSSWKGLKGYVHSIYSDIAQTNPDLLFYVCGWKNMCVETRQQLKILGFSRRQYKFEQYD